jgi:hypothetical protein
MPVTSPDCETVAIVLSATLHDVEAGVTLAPRALANEAVTVLVRSTSTESTDRSNAMFATGAVPLAPDGAVPASLPQLAIAAIQLASNSDRAMRDGTRMPCRQDPDRNDTCVLVGRLEPIDMPILRSVTAALVSRRSARRLARIIPNPVVRYAVVTAVTALVPIAMTRITERWHRRRTRGAMAGSAGA